MTRKDYIRIAAAFKLSRPGQYEPDMETVTKRYRQWERDVSGLVSALASDNPKFDAGRFATACGVNEEKKLLEDAEARYGKELITPAYKQKLVDKNVTKFVYARYIYETNNRFYVFEEPESGERFNLRGAELSDEVRKAVHAAGTTPTFGVILEYRTTPTSGLWYATRVAS